MPRPAALLCLALSLDLAACDGSDGLVGTWMPAGAAEGSRTTFFADGTARIVTRAEDGTDEAYDARYAVSGDTALVLSDGQGTERFRFRIARDTLVLESPTTGNQTVLVRLGL
ncbi:MAG TPA: hypothetical protein VGB53_05260 [Rubricoccaceae bacterium]